jgi:hypothetical protein
MQTPKILLQIYYYNITRKRTKRDNDEPKGSLSFYATKEKLAQDNDE